LALELVQGDYYIVNSTLQIAGGGEISAGTMVMLRSPEEGRWDVQLQVVNESGLEEPVRVSEEWFKKSSMYFGPIQQESQAQDAVLEDLTKSIDTQIQLVQNEQMNPTEKKCSPEVSLRPVARPAHIEQRAELGSTRPVPRPEALQVDADLEALLFKSDNEKDSYLACYERERSYTDDYRNKYKNSIAVVSKAATTVAQGNGERIDEGDFNTLLTCLIFRESAHFEGGSSHSGAVGLGQFTGIAVKELKNMLNHSPRDSESLDQISELGNLWREGSIENIDYQRALASRVSNMNMRSRRDEIKAFWEALPFEKPSSSQINKSYMGDNDNHEVVIAASAMMLRDCALRLKNERESMDANLRLLACAGAYNMGVGGFKRNALSRNSNGGIYAWVNNLKNSGSGQANETINHIISINRCIQKEKNYPPCGTRSSHCQELNQTEICSDPKALKCVGEC
tara:strand:+ start:17989 stop:19350 length:1362 start_codon:yes stop_codon:yes gene_type:complete